MFTSYKDIMHTLYQCDRFSQVFEEILNLLEKNLQKNGISMHQGMTTVMPYEDGTVGIIDAAFYFEAVYHGKTYSIGLRFRPLETRYRKENAGMIHDIMNMAPDKAAAYIADKIIGFQIVTEFDGDDVEGVEYDDLTNKISYCIDQAIDAAEEPESVNEKDN